MTKLKASLGLPLVTLYGLGTILGAGIYVLVGKVVGIAGIWAPISFLFAGAVALITAFSYAQLVSLYPKSGGPAIYVWQAFSIRSLSILVGWLIILTGVVSAATLCRGFTGYLGVFIQVPPSAAIVMVVLILGSLAAWGIVESMWVAALMTLIEIFGLLLVIYYGADSIPLLPEIIQKNPAPLSFLQFSGIMAGAFLAFYAFIGFEDMVNIVEEVRNPQKTLPRSIFIAVLISTVLYVLISLIAVTAVPMDQIAHSEAPLAFIVETHSPLGKQAISAISLFAILNGVLIQTIMASRVLYGMAAISQTFSRFSQINVITRTPVYATLLIVLLILVFALLLPLVTLAQLTSFIILFVFLLVNSSLWTLKKRTQDQSQFTLPSFPVLGMLTCALLLIMQVSSTLMISYH